MTGTLITSHDGIAPCSKQANSNTITDLMNEVRYTNGCMGSVFISESYTKNNCTISTGWWCFLYIPHRSGGSIVDNGNWGCLVLFGMTTSIGTMYTVSLANGSINNVLSH